MIFCFGWWDDFAGRRGGEEAGTSKAKNRRTKGNQDSNFLPILCDIERPLELKMGMVVVVDELGNSIVVTAGDHA